MNKTLVSGMLMVLLLCACGGTNSFNAPTDVAVRAKASRIELSWKAVPSIIGYRIYRSTASGSVSTKERIASALSLTAYRDSFSLIREIL